MRPWCPNPARLSWCRRQEARRSCRERRWRLIRSRSGFAQGLVSMFLGSFTSRPPPGIFLPAAVGSSAACIMPSPIRHPSAHLTRVLERDRFGSVARHHATSSGIASRKGRPWMGCLSRGSARSFSHRQGLQIWCSQAGAGSGDVAGPPDTSRSPDWHRFGVSPAKAPMSRTLSSHMTKLLIESNVWSDAFAHWLLPRLETSGHEVSAANDTEICTGSGHGCRDDTMPRDHSLISRISRPRPGF